MKKGFFALAFLTVMVMVRGQTLPAGVTPQTRIYLIRHAEKATTPPDNPPLSAAGKIRAGALLRRLKNSGISRMYVTQFLRTQMTADSLRLQKGIDTVHYLAEENGNDLFNKIRIDSDFSRRILVIGHSNTIPDYILKLGVANYPVTDIPSVQFNNLYIVYYKRKFLLFGKMRAFVKKEKYGAL